MRLGGARLSIGLLIASSRVASAQGEIQGRVLSDSGRQPLANVQATITRLGRTATTDSLGRFRLTGLPADEHVIVVKALGYVLNSARVETTANEVVAREFVLKRAVTALPEQRVTADGPPVVRGKMASFTERRRLGIGTFLDRAQFADAEGRMLTGDVLSKVPGVRLQLRGRRAWATSGRQLGTTCAFCTTSRLNRFDRAAGAQSACFMDIYIDGALVFTNSQSGEGLFDVNTIDPGAIEGIEVYASAAQVPVQYNRTAGGCGVILIWTRA